MHNSVDTNFEISTKDMIKNQVKKEDKVEENQLWLHTKFWIGSVGIIKKAIYNFEAQ